MSTTTTTHPRLSSGTSMSKAASTGGTGGFNNDLKMLADVVTPSTPGRSGAPKLDVAQHGDSFRALLSLKLKRVTSSARG